MVVAPATFLSRKPRKCLFLGTIAVFGCIELFNLRASIAVNRVAKNNSFSLSFVNPDFAPATANNTNATSGMSATKGGDNQAVRLQETTIKDIVMIGNFDMSAASYIDCRLQMENYLHDKMRTWIHEDIPMLLNSYQVETTRHLHLYLKHLDKADHPKWRYGPWYCDSQNHTPAQVENFEGFKSSEMIVKCPAGQLPFSSSSSSWVLTFGNNNDTSSPFLSYDLRPYFHCDDLARKEPPPRPSVPPLIGACTEIKGQSNRHFAAQWVEYHHLIGVDHLWVYINEPWNTSWSLPQRPYVTYVPYDDHWDDLRRGMKRSMFDYAYFQEAQNNECLFRGRQYGVEWMVMLDVDEYIHIENPLYANRTGPILKEYLTAVDNKTNNGDLNQSPTAHTASAGDLNSSSQTLIGNIKMTSIPYGTNTKLQHPNTSQYDTFVLDYIWRNKAPPESIGLVREKNIVKPAAVGFLNIHYIHNLQPGYVSQVRGANDIRIDHFKWAWKRILVYKGPRTVVADPYLRDLFGKSLRLALADHQVFSDPEAIPITKQ
jgi:hypothetical protein